MKDTKNTLIKFVKNVSGGVMAEECENQDERRCVSSLWDDNKSVATLINKKDYINLLKETNNIRSASLLSSVFKYGEKLSAEEIIDILKSFKDGLIKYEKLTGNNWKKGFYDLIAYHVPKEILVLIPVQEFVVECCPQTLSIFKYNADRELIDKVLSSNGDMINELVNDNYNFIHRYPDIVVKYCPNSLKLFNESGTPISVNLIETAIEKFPEQIQYLKPNTVLYDYIVKLDRGTKFHLSNLYREACYKSPSCIKYFSKNEIELEECVNIIDTFITSEQINEFIENIDKDLLYDVPLLELFNRKSRSINTLIKALPKSHIHCLLSDAITKHRRKPNMFTKKDLNDFLLHFDKEDIIKAVLEFI